MTDACCLSCIYCGVPVGSQRSDLLGHLEICPVYQKEK